MANSAVASCLLLVVVTTWARKISRLFCSSYSLVRQKLSRLVFFDCGRSTCRRALRV